MTIQLNQRQIDILQRAVDEGRFESVEDALENAVLAFQAMAPSNDELDWAVPDVDEARKSVAKGKVVSGDAFQTELRAMAARLRQ